MSSPLKREVRGSNLYLVKSDTVLPLLSADAISSKVAILPGRNDAEMGPANSSRFGAIQWVKWKIWFEGLASLNLLQGIKTKSIISKRMLNRRNYWLKTDRHSSWSFIINWAQVKLIGYIGGYVGQGPARIWGISGFVNSKTDGETDKFLSELWCDIQKKGLHQNSNGFCGRK